MGVSNGVLASEAASRRASSTAKLAAQGVLQSQLSAPSLRLAEDARSVASSRRSRASARPL